MNKAHKKPECVATAILCSGLEASHSVNWEARVAMDGTLGKGESRDAKVACAPVSGAQSVEMEMPEISEVRSDRSESESSTPPATSRRVTPTTAARRLDK